MAQPLPISEPIAVRRVVRIRGGAAEVGDDRLAVEEPLELRLDGKPTTVIMRTPGYDEELARGFFFTEGLIGRNEDLLSMRRPDDLRDEERNNVLDVEVSPPLLKLKPFQRNFYASSSCGVCGKSSLASLAISARPVVSPPGLSFSQSLISGFPGALRAAQVTFEATGGLHAAALFDEHGTLVVLREDVGRHNAVDKVVGWALANGRLPASRMALQVSGRTSFEILQKAIMAGVPIVCAVSAPSSLAVQLAERFGVTLVGFLRGGSMNVYSHEERIV